MQPSFVETVSEPTVESMVDSMHATDESIEEYQDRLVARGFSQGEGVDLVEACASVARVRVEIFMNQIEDGPVWFMILGFQCQ